MMCDIGNIGVYITYTYTYVLDMYFNSVGSSEYLHAFSLQMIKSISSTCSARHRMQVVDIISNSFNHIVAFISEYIYIYMGCFQCLFPESIVWYVLMGSHFLFNSFLIMCLSQSTQSTNLCTRIISEFHLEFHGSNKSLDFCSWQPEFLFFGGLFWCICWGKLWVHFAPRTFEESDTN